MTKKLNESNEPKKDTISRWEHLVDLYQMAKNDSSLTRWRKFGLELLKFTALIILKLVWKKIVCHFLKIFGWRFLTAGNNGYQEPCKKCTGFRFSNLIVMLVTMRPTGRNFKNILEITTRKAHKYYRGRKCLSTNGLKHKNHGNIYMHENVRRNMHVQNCPHNALYERR